MRTHSIHGGGPGGLAWPFRTSLTRRAVAWGNLLSPPANL